MTYQRANLDIVWFGLEDVITTSATEVPQPPEPTGTANPNGQII